MKDKTYTVSWVIQVEATSPEAAAEQAEQLFLSADDRTSWVFGVAPDTHDPVMLGQLNIEVTKGKGRRIRS